MRYNLESLEPERFQQLCQSLLVTEYAGMQCFPVGQPDGGRDAVQYLDASVSEFNVFQIKFVRKGDVEDPRIWVNKIISGEMDKISRLIERGAKKYVLMTNISGTGHLDVGSIDFLNKYLSEEIGIPTFVMWRDDLEARLDNSWDVKLQFPEIMSGKDFLRLIFESKSASNYQRLHNAVMAFLTNQYIDDAEVKFRQIEFQTKLLDIFIDLPFSITANKRPLNVMGTAEAILAKIHVYHVGKGERVIIKDSVDENDSMGTATFLLSKFGGDNFSQIVMEGAPGQGKSTLAQYLCQVHRIRWLNKEEDLGKLPDNHKSSPLHLPIKVDLRDFSSWLSGIHPFSPSDIISVPQVSRSFEGFLAFLVSCQSGGIDFDINDLLEFSRLAPLLIVLDGLDEIAEIQKRREIINLVSKGAPRIKENCRGMKLVVTSRPSNFENSPGFDQDHYPVLQLGSVTKTQIFQYAGRWMTARNFNWREKLDLVNTLEVKLHEPHIRDLARNPMQLAILLSLVHTEGPALPDKRTALYYYYVDRFFSREAGKTPIVSQYLELLKDIHGYVAWVLHSSAELGPSNRRLGAGGKITLDELKMVLRDYLNQEQQDTRVIDDVFQAMMTRVFMLVSRVEGTYEFEVQPLREYFAARFLYDTASYSPPGQEKSGTKPDRFDAVARNFYWLNVVRFFCGCFGKGELLDLADRVRELIRDPVIGYTRHPATLAAMLLADSVFSQSPRAINEVSAALAEINALRYLVTTRLHHLSSLPLQIPERSGGTTIMAGALDHLIGDTPRWDFAKGLVDLVRSNMTQERIYSWWSERAKDSLAHDKERWIRLGSILGCLEKAPRQVITESVPAPYSRETVVLLLENGRFDCFSECNENVDILENIILNGDAPFSEWDCKYPFFLLLPFICVVPYLGYGWSWGRRRSFIDSLASFSKMVDEAQYSGEITASEFATKAWQFSIDAKKELGDQSDLSLVKMEAWERVLDSALHIWGDRPALIDCALFMSSMSRGRRGRYKCNELLDVNFPIVDRLRYARLQSKNPAWWKIQHNLIKGAEDLRLFHMSFWFMVSEEVALSMAADLAASLDEMEDTHWASLEMQASRSIYPAISYSVDWEAQIIPEMEKSTRFGFMMAIKFPQRFAGSYFINAIKSSDLPKGVMSEFQQAFAVKAALAQKWDWSDALALVRKTYKSGTSFLGGQFSRSGKRNAIPDYVVEEIICNPEAYPVMLWDRAVALRTARARKAIKPVAHTAEREKWFKPGRR